MSKTKRIHIAISAIDIQLDALKQREEILLKRLQNLNNIAMSIDDPHAVIPKSYRTLDEWFKGHPFPKSLINHICKNEYKAREMQDCCNTYYFDYHVVPCQPKAYYIEKYLNK